MNVSGRKVQRFVVLCCSLFLVSMEAQAQRHKKKEEDKVVSIYDVDTLLSPVPMQRSLFFDKVSKQQRRADVSDGAIDGVIDYGEDSVATRILTQTIMKDVRQVQIMIENLPIADKFAENQTKLGYHRALENLLINYNNDNKKDALYYKKLVANFRNMVIAKQENRLHDFVQANVNVYTLANNDLLDEQDKDYVCQEVGKVMPERMIKKLSQFASKPCADVVIAAAAKVVPDDVFNYATSTNMSLRGAVERNQDPLVKTIVKISRESRAPLKAKPFLSDIYNKRLTIAEVDKITSDPDLFFKNLVRLKLQNDELGSSSYTDELQYRGMAYVRKMNELHEEKLEKVRFKCIDSLSPEAMYYVIVFGQEEIYTSSFIGAFKRLMERMKPMTGDELLAKVHYDKFRTFIRMCAGYNTLGTFLATIPEEKKSALMSDFIANLEKGKEDDLEGAVDVADAFGSITDPQLTDFLKNEVKKNYERCYAEKSKKGLKVYALLATLFDGSKDSVTNEAAAEQSSRLNLPPINSVPYQSLTGDDSIVYQQFFFYGDEDGKVSFASFMTNFKDGKWKITNSKYWTCITSTSGKPVTIYANLPLPEPEDEEAQNQLNKYLDEKNITASVIVHRGHSYHLPTTLERLNKRTKVVVLGSCGGYHNLATILSASPDAQIISTKQTGAMAVNEPIVKAIDEQLLAGNDINWVNMWKGLGTYFKGKTSEATFKEYVPPYKNLGAIFIKAYRRLEALETE